MRVFDLHCDTLFECDVRGEGLARNGGYLDWERMAAFEEYIPVLAAFVPDSLRGEGAWQHINRLLDLADECPHAAHAARALFAVESAAGVDGDLSRLQALRDRGVRVMTLTWNGANEWGCGVDATGGLTLFGMEGLKELERVGIVADVSHLNEEGFWDVARLAKKPFVASHSVSQAVYPHRRNLTDAQFGAMRDSGGLVGLHFIQEQLGGSTFEQWERHLAQFLALGGEDTVAIGSDFDGTTLPEEWTGVEMLPKLYEYLRGKYSEAILEKLFWGNAERFFFGEAQGLTAH